MIMNRTGHTIHKTAFFIAAILTSADALPQIYPAVTSLPARYNEKFAVFTDRSLYMAGEDLFFSVINYTEKKIQSACRSKVFYVELMKAGGEVVAEAKFPLTAEGTEGHITIPEKIPAGIYFLRCYTRWMRNFSPAGFAYDRIKIINPAMMESESWVTDTSGRSMPWLTVDTTALNAGTSIRCTTDKPLYGIREKAVLSVGIPSGLRNMQERYCITVTRPGAVDNSRRVFFSWKEGAENQYPLSYIPESNGLTVSGTVLGKKTNEPVRNALVQLAVLDEKGDYFNYYTEPDGKFIFSLLPLTGRQDLFISARNAADDELEIHVDKDYANHNSALYAGPFILDPQERSLAREIMVNAQVTKAYDENKIPVSVPVQADSFLRCFYGTPSKTVYIDDFIALPTLEEVFFELVPEVSIGKRKGITYMMLTGNTRSNADLAAYSPLILLDRIPISSLKDLLEVSPAKIQRIEILNDVYIKGNVVYGGIVSIFSRKGDLAGITLPRNSFFFYFSGYSNPPGGQVRITPPLDKRIPDFRNCLYWNPAVHLKAGETENLEFYTSDSRGEFEVILEGITAEGESIEKRCRFRVE
jgi:hypothetical protein